MQFDTGRQDEFVRDLDGVVVAGEQRHTSRFGPTDPVHIAEAAATVLQIGFEEERDLAGVPLPVGDAGVEFGQPPLRALLPGRTTLLGELHGERRIAGEMPHRQHCSRGVEIVGGQFDGLLDRAHGMAELDALIPDRIPDPLGQLADIDAAVVQQVEINIAAR